MALSLPLIAFSTRGARPCTRCSVPLVFSTLVCIYTTISEITSLSKVVGVFCSDKISPVSDATVKPDRPPKNILSVYLWFLHYLWKRREREWDFEREIIISKKNRNYIIYTQNTFYTCVYLNTKVWKTLCTLRKKWCRMVYIVVFNQCCHLISFYC